jgi:hypothetical protein
MGTNMYPSSSLLGQHKDESIASLPVDELIEKADGFAGVFPGSFLFIYIVGISFFLVESQYEYICIYIIHTYRLA